jgi:hypothetical protein
VKQPSARWLQSCPRSIDWTFGVVGLGNIGTAGAKSLIQSGKRVLVFDKTGICETSLKEVKCDSLKSLFSESTVTIGCTGIDIFSGVDWWRELKGEKVLVRTQSSNRYFSQRNA